MRWTSWTRPRTGLPPELCVFTHETGIGSLGVVARRPKAFIARARTTGEGQEVGRTSDRIRMDLCPVWDDRELHGGKARTIRAAAELGSAERHRVLPRLPAEDGGRGEGGGSSLRGFAGRTTCGRTPRGGWSSSWTAPLTAATRASRAPAAPTSSSFGRCESASARIRRVRSDPLAPAMGSRVWMHGDLRRPRQGRAAGADR